jgi:hypothetical protein
VGDGAVGKVCDGEFFCTVGTVLPRLLDVSLDFVYNECISGMTHVIVAVLSSQHLYYLRVNTYQPVRPSYLEC